MKINLILGAFSISASSFCLAVGESPKDSPTESVSPCKDVMTACRAAGYTQGGHKDGKGLHADCIGKLFKGESVSGVVVTAEQIVSCKDRHEKMMEGRVEKKKSP